MKLKKSKVIFIEEGHHYLLNDTELQGITGLLSRQLFPDDYKEIPEDILMRAAEYGTMIHNACQGYDENGDMPMTAEVENYAKLTDGMVHEASEYLVSDELYYASKIDKVYRIDKNTFDLGDIKTCSKGTMNVEKLRWQLSIYATLFEYNNPKCKVRNLFGIWLRTKGNDNIHEIIPVERIPDDEVWELMRADAGGRKYQAPATITDMMTMPKDVIELQQTIIDMIQQEAELKAKLDELKAGILERMINANVKSWESDMLKMTSVAQSTKSAFDSKAFQAAHPEMEEEFAKFTKTTTTKPSIKITIRK